MISIGFTAPAGEPKVDIKPCGRLDIWPTGTAGPLMTISVVEWYALVAAVNEKLEGVLCDRA